MAESVSDTEFLKLFENALRTELTNLDQLAEHKSLFPIGDKGVAQGSALSTLAGNIILQDFDRRFNDRGIVCVRYVDDFILLGPRESSVRGAFESVLKFLGNLGMSAYSPWDDGQKAECGDVRRGFTFLGCDVFANGHLI